MRPQYDYCCAREGACIHNPHHHHTTHNFGCTWDGTIIESEPYLIAQPSPKQMGCPTLPKADVLIVETSAGVWHGVLCLCITTTTIRFIFIPTKHNVNHECNGQIMGTTNSLVLNREAMNNKLNMSIVDLFTICLVEDVRVMDTRMPSQVNP